MKAIVAITFTLTLWIVALTIVGLTIVGSP